jgi:hypothetical protein
LPEEAQLASARHIAAAATPRAALKTGSDARIPIRPNYHSAKRLPIWQAASATRFLARPTCAPSCEDTAFGTRRKWGEACDGEQMVTMGIVDSRTHRVFMDGTLIVANGFC